VVISGNAFKETEVDFNKGNSRDVVSWLLDDDELEEQLKQTQAKREAEEAEAVRNGTKKKSRGKKKLGISSLEGPAASRTLEDLYHEGNTDLITLLISGEGNFEDVSARASGTATPASGVEPGPLMKKTKVSKSGETHKTAVKRSHKRRSAAQAPGGYLEGENGDVEMTDA
jgi:chromatin-remodeling ATPase INO80